MESPSRLLLQCSNGDTGRKQICGHREEDGQREERGNIYYHVYRWQVGICCVMLGTPTQCSVTTQRVGYRGRIRREGYMYPVAVSC